MRYSLSFFRRNECQLVHDLQVTYRLLQNALRARSDLMRCLWPTFSLTGSVQEGARLNCVGEIDVNVEFAGLRGLDLLKFHSRDIYVEETRGATARPDQINAASPQVKRVLGDATKLIVNREVEGNPLGEFCTDEDDGTTLDYLKFFAHFLKEIAKCLEEITLPERLSVACHSKDFNACERCREETERHRLTSTLYDPARHCEDCLPVVTQTKLGACLIFRWKKGDVDRVVTMDLIPIFPMEMPANKKRTLPAAVIETLRRKKPPYWLAYLQSFLQRDRIVGRDAEVGDGISVKVLNYGPKDNYVIRPGQTMKWPVIRPGQTTKWPAIRPGQTMSWQEMANVKAAYCTIKGIKGILGISFSSYFIKKVLLKPQHLEEVKKDASSKPLIIFDTLNNFRIKDGFSNEIDFYQWDLLLKDNFKCPTIPLLKHEIGGEVALSSLAASASENKHRRRRAIWNRWHSKMFVHCMLK